jgi:hypothetical protein
MDEQYTIAAAGLAQRIRCLVDPSRVDMHKICTQTSKTNRDILLSWREQMGYHEFQTKNCRERVYLVVSDLRLLAISELSLGQGKWHSAHTDPPNKLFLRERDINSLHENHWAVEVDERYYELVRLPGDRSRFSSDHRVQDNDRQILARIFIGTTHLGQKALNDIGR